MWANRHDNQYLQRSFNKYGEEAFEFTVLQLCAEQVLTSLEQVYLDTPVDGTYFNLSLVAGVPPRMIGENHPKFGKKFPEHAALMRTGKNPMKRQEQRERMCGEGNPMFGIASGDHPNARKVCRLDDTGTIIVGTWDSLTEAAKSVGGRPQSIGRCAGGSQKTAYGAVWRYLVPLNQEMETEE